MPLVEPNSEPGGGLATGIPVRANGALHGAAVHGATAWTATTTVPRRGPEAWLERALDHEQVLGYLLVAPVVVLLLALVAWPFGISVSMALTDRSRALYSGLDRAWDQAANELFAARAAISAGDQERSVTAADQVQHWLRLVADP